MARQPKTDVEAAPETPGAVAVLGAHDHAPDPQMNVVPWFDQKAQDLALMAAAKTQDKPQAPALPDEPQDTEDN